MGWEPVGALAVPLALASLGGFLLLSPDGRRLEVLPTPYLREDPVLLDPFIEPSKKAIESLALSEPDISQPGAPLPSLSLWGHPSRPGARGGASDIIVTALEGVNQRRSPQIHRLIQANTSLAPCHRRGKMAVEQTSPSPTRCKDYATRGASLPIPGQDDWERYDGAERSGAVLGFSLLLRIREAHPAFLEPGRRRWFMPKNSPQTTRSTDIFGPGTVPVPFASQITTSGPPRPRHRHPPPHPASRFMY